MKLTTLGLGTSPPSQGIGHMPGLRPSTNCPTCNATKDKRDDGGSFGGHTAEYCGNCGYEFSRERTT